MDEATIAQTILSIYILAVFVGFFIWGLRSGQFKNIEEAKYRMLRNDKENDSKAKNGRETDDEH